MDNIYAPQTIIELEIWMKENCFNFNTYSINGNRINEGFGIDRSDKMFVWYYTERGQRNNLKYFQSENDIVQFAFNKINGDKWSKTHRVGFSHDKIKIDKLKKELQSHSVEFFEDKIPYYGTTLPIYRIFVFGCDIRKTEHLKEIYLTDKY